ncbi:hypothetical protein N9L68_01680 [bacterium]|nr:hypothetical protein [bacterium]
MEKVGKMKIADPCSVLPRPILVSEGDAHAILAEAMRVHQYDIELRHQRSEATGDSDPKDRIQYGTQVPRETSSEETTEPAVFRGLAHEK